MFSFCQTNELSIFILCDFFSMVEAVWAVKPWFLKPELGNCSFIFYIAISDDWLLSSRIELVARLWVLAFVHELSISFTRLLTCSNLFCLKRLGTNEWARLSWLIWMFFFFFWVNCSCLWRKSLFSLSMTF